MKSLNRKRFTQQGVERLRYDKAAAPASGRIEIEDEACPGLLLRVTPRNVKSFSVIYRVLGEGGTVHRQKRPGGAIAATVNRAGDQFLAGAGFADYEYIDIGLGYLFDRRKHFFHRRTGADDVVDRHGVSNGQWPVVGGQIGLVMQRCITFSN